ncbi:hypothetical protein GCM10009849_11850 [Sinomonas flava]|uniref:Glycosyl transferases group 1 n=1 Tax=Sinomonas flava TaxID=496857 RepID=A0ABN3BPR3_9MICC
MRLRLWARSRRNMLLWCNGLVPAFALSGLGRRIVHLHQLPLGGQRWLASLARKGALDTLVPSHWMSHHVPGSIVFGNWVEQVKAVRPAPEDVLRIGFLGRLSSDKGIHVLAEAVQILNDEGFDCRLVVAGEPRFVSDKAARFVDQALDRIAPNVDRLGWVEPGNLFSRVDLFACPSVWNEPFGLVAAEAMSARVPIVASRSGALPEVTGASAWLTTPEDAVDLARAIRRAAESPRKRESAEEGFARWEREWSPKAGRRRTASMMRRWELSGTDSMTRTDVS